jgi:FixJ family two-component response regulator
VIAIVDDDEAVREALCDLLQVESLPCRGFDSAAAFLKDYAPDRFNCLVTDIRMPGIDGFELQQQLRALRSNLPVIVITSATDEGSYARAMDAGALACLTKPVADEVFLGHVRRALGGSVVAGGEHPKS